MRPESTIGNMQRRVIRTSLQYHCLVIECTRDSSVSNSSAAGDDSCIVSHLAVTAVAMLASVQRDD